MSSLKNFLQRRWIRFLVKNLFNTISQENVLEINEKGVFIRGEKLDQETIDGLKEDAEKFHNSSLWKLLSNEVKYACNVRMYERGRTDDDILAGKCSLYTLEVIEKTIEDITKL